MQNLEAAAEAAAIADGLAPAPEGGGGGARSPAELSSPSSSSPREAEDESPRSRKGKKSLRRGKWTQEEEQYANKLIEEFKNGLLPLKDNTTLRTFLSVMLNCDPMRISKKFVGPNCIGKQVFKRRTDITSLSQEAEDRNRAELADLEQRFMARVQQVNKTKANTPRRKGREAKAKMKAGEQQGEAGGVPGNGDAPSSSASAASTALVNHMFLTGGPWESMNLGGVDMAAAAAGAAGLPAGARPNGVGKDKGKGGGATKAANGRTPAASQRGNSGGQHSAGSLSQASSSSTYLGQSQGGSCVGGGSARPSQIAQPECSDGMPRAHSVSQLPGGQMNMSPSMQDLTMLLGIPHGAAVNGGTGNGSLGFASMMFPSFGQLPTSVSSQSLMHAGSSSSDLANAGQPAPLQPPLPVLIGTMQQQGHPVTQESIAALAAQAGYPMKHVNSIRDMRFEMFSSLVKSASSDDFLNFMSDADNGLSPSLPSFNAEPSDEAGPGHFLSSSPSRDTAGMPRQLSTGSIGDGPEPKRSRGIEAM
jgi:hypothetical protein